MNLIWSALFFLFGFCFGGCVFTIIYLQSKREAKKKMLEKEHKEFIKKVNEANAISYARRVKQQSEEARKLREEIEKLDGYKAPEPPKEAQDV